jgi:hypothetical protein
VSRGARWILIAVGGAISGLFAFNLLLTRVVYPEPYADPTGPDVALLAWATAVLGAGATLVWMHFRSMGASAVLAVLAAAALGLGVNRLLSPQDCWSTAVGCAPDERCNDASCRNSFFNDLGSARVGSTEELTDLRKDIEDRAKAAGAGTATATTGVVLLLLLRRRATLREEPQLDTSGR